MKKEEPGMTSGSIMQSEEASDGLPVPSHLYLLERPYPSAFRARFWFAIGSRDYQDVFSLQKATFFLSSFSPHVLFSLFWTARRHREGFQGVFFVPLFRACCQTPISIREHGYAFCFVASSKREMRFRKLKGGP
jgi:hypothetical protein